MAVLEVFERNPKILVLDSDPDSRSMLRINLQAEHYDVITAENKTEGLSLASTIQPDLILINTVSHEQSPFSVCEQLKRDITTCAIPIIFLTNQEDVPNIVTAMKLGAADYVVKPYLSTELQTRIRIALVLLQEKERLRDKIQQLKASFWGVLSRELRKPVTVIAGFAELLEQKMARLTPSMKLAYLQGILHQADYISHVIDDIQSILTSEMKSEMVDVIAMVKSAADQFHQNLENAGIKVSVNPPKHGRIFTVGSNWHLSISMKHLLSLVQKFTRSSGKITIDVIPDRSTVQIVVSNMEPYLTQSPLSGIVGTYTKDDSIITDRFKGVELYLAIARFVAEQHRGNVSLDGQLGQGCRIRMELPQSHVAKTNGRCPLNKRIVPKSV